MKFITITSIAASALGLIAWSSASSDAEGVAYPAGYREWAHVKSALVSPTHPRFDDIGGFHHIYANAEAMAGYRSGAFDDGAIIVFDWLRMTEKDAVFIEGSRRRLDVMVRDSKRFAATGGWGFERFAGDSKTERADSPPREQCFACHEKLAKDDLVVSEYRL